MKKLATSLFISLTTLSALAQYYSGQTYTSESGLPSYGISYGGYGYDNCIFNGITFTGNTSNVYFQDCTFNNVTFSETTLFDDVNGNRFHGENTFTGNTNFCLDNGYVDLEDASFSGTLRFKGSSDPDEIGEVASGINLKGADFRNVTNNDIFETKVGTTNVVWRNIDFRNAKFSDANKPNFANMEAVIGTDGRIYNLDLSNGGEIEITDGFYEDYDHYGEAGRVYPAATLKDNVVMNGASIYIEEDKLVIDGASLTGVAASDPDSENTIEVELSGKDMPLITVQNKGTLDLTNIELEIEIDQGGILDTNGKPLAEIVGTKFTIIEWGEDCNVYINSEEVDISAYPEYYYGEWQFNPEDWQFIVDWENRVAFITAVPEPAEWAIILGGVALLFVIRRKRK